MKRTQPLSSLREEQAAGPTNPLAGLRLNFHKAPLHSVLNYFHDVAHLPIEVESNVEIDSTIELWNEKPVTREEAIRLLRAALDEKGYIAIDKHGMLAILRSQDAKKHYIALPTINAFAG